MAKRPNKNEKQLVAMDEKTLSQQASIALSRLGDIIGGPDISLKEMKEAIAMIEAETNENASPYVVLNDYFGNASCLRWQRLETDEEQSKRLERNKKQAAAARKARATNKKKKEADERAELLRLKEKYPDLA